MTLNPAGNWRTGIAACATATLFSVSSLAASAPAADASPDNRTATPIKHVIIIVGENRRFDHLFATYVPKRRHEKILNLLSERIVNADGTPSPQFAKAQQFQIPSAPNGGKFFSSADLNSKMLYATLPPPDVAGVGAVSPYVGILSLPGGAQGLLLSDQFLFGTGAT